MQQLNRGCNYIMKTIATSRSEISGDNNILFGEHIFARVLSVLKEKMKGVGCKAPGNVAKL